MSCPYQCLCFRLLVAFDLTHIVLKIHEREWNRVTNGASPNLPCHPTWRSCDKVASVSGTVATSWQVQHSKTKWPVAGVMAPMMNLWWRTAVWCSLLELRNKCHFYDPCETVARFGWRPLVWCVVWVSHRMLRVSVLLGAFLSPASSWWFTNNTKPEDPGPWHMWLQDHSPYLHEYVLAAENGFDRFAQEHYVELPRFDAGLWLVIDTLVGLVGWAIFGSAWNEVRLGCQRVFQFTALILWHVQT